MGNALGLFLLVQPAGGKLWRLEYRLGGKDARAVTGGEGYVFPSIRTRSRPMSDNTINAGAAALPTPQMK